MLAKEGVKVALNTEIREDLPTGCEAEVVVLALGAIPNVGGLHNVVSAYDVWVRCLVWQ